VPFCLETLEAEYAALSDGGEADTHEAAEEVARLESEIAKLSGKREFQPEHDAGGAIRERLRTGLRSVRTGLVAAGSEKRKKRECG
jgi:hypothetical protein